MIRLAIGEGDEVVHRTFREPSITIGRSDKCDLTLSEARGLSRFHCRLTVAGQNLARLEDLGSRNGTLVNGHVMLDGELRAGDRLECGSLTCVVEAINDEEPTEELVKPCLHCGHVFSAGRSACPRCGASAAPEGRGRRITEDAFPGYRVLRKIGTGGMGVVFEAEDIEHQRPVALKVLRPHLARDLEFVAQFIEEVRLLTALRHPGIVQVHGRGHTGALHYVAMEFVEGSSVRTALRERGRLAPETASRIALEAARALNVAHQQAGVIHGDVKPGNMLLHVSGRMKLCDFGLARVEQRTRARREEPALSDRRGTAAYAAPERFGRGGQPSLASDAYALGISLFQMLTGRLPFAAGSAAELARAHRDAPVPDLAEFGIEGHRALQMMLRRLLNKKPERRMEDWPSLIADLGLLVR